MLLRVRNVGSSSAKVSIIADTDAAGATYTAEAAHILGDRLYAKDSDSTLVYFAKKSGATRCHPHISPRLSVLMMLTKSKQPQRHRQRIQHFNNSY